MGFAFTYNEGSSTAGSCTYFSRIDSVEVAVGTIAVTTADYDMFDFVLPPTSTSTPTVPRPTPAPSSTNVAVLHICKGWTSLPSQLHAVEDHTFGGAAIRTDWGVKVCDDCAARCWLQMSDCMGFAFTYYEDSSTMGSCTYFSRISGITVASGTLSVTSVDVPL